jgi:hypothetical protein
VPLLVDEYPSSGHPTAIGGVDESEDDPFICPVGLMVEDKGEAPTVEKPPCIIDDEPPREDRPAEAKIELGDEPREDECSMDDETGTAYIPFCIVGKSGIIPGAGARSIGVCDTLEEEGRC